MATAVVVDSSVLAKFLFKEEGWREAGRVPRERLFTLELAVKETANALWRRATLLRDISLERALTLFNDLLRLRQILRVEAQEAYLPDAFSIAVNYNITVYDALFIAQAKAKNAVLVTADEKQYSVALQAGVEAKLTM